MLRDKDYHQYSNYDLEPGGLRKLDFIVSKIKTAFDLPTNQISILDIGCGSGNIARPLANLGYLVTAIDKSTQAIAELKEKDPEQKITPIIQLFENYNTGQQFDVIIMSEVLEHTEEPGSVLAKVQKMLKQNGLLIITIPNGLSMEETIRRAMNFNPAMKSVKKSAQAKMLEKEVQTPAKSPHLHFWSALAIQSLIKSADFKITDFRAASFLFKEAYYVIGRFFMKRGSWLFHKFDGFDSNMAKFVPPIFGSGFLIVCKKK